jgi:hypothetical protein
MQFSYTLYKRHYEQMQLKKMEYQKYFGQEREMWAHKDEKWQSIWTTLGLAGLMVGLIGGAVYIVHLK